MTIQQKQQWLETRKPLTIVATESRFGHYVFRAYPYTPEEVANSTELTHEQSASADSAVTNLCRILQDEVDDYSADFNN